MAGKSKEERFLRNNKEYYNKIIDYISSLNIDIKSFEEKRYWYDSNKKEYNKCLIKDCNNIVDSTRFISYDKSYNNYCCIKCSKKSDECREKRRSTNLERYGVINVAQTKEVRAKMEETSMEKYGVTNANKSKQTRDKIRKTIKEKYGVDSLWERKGAKENIDNKIKEKFGEDYQQVFRNKQKVTNVKKYGTISYTGTEKYKEKVKETSQEKYGVDHWSSSSIVREKVIETVKERFGVEHISQLEEIKDKKVKTSLEHYGVEHPRKSKEIIQKIKDVMYEKYGTYNPRMLIKNNTKVSKVEKQIKETLNVQEFRFKDKEFDFIYGNDIFEIDGDYFHPIKIENTNLVLIGGIINDYIKEKSLLGTNYTLYRVLISKLPKDITTISLEKLKEISYKKNYSITNNQIILNKEYLNKAIQQKGKDEILKRSKVLIKFVRKLQSEIEIDFTLFSDNTLFLAVSKILNNNLDFTLNNLKEEIYKL